VLSHFLQKRTTVRSKDGNWLVVLTSEKYESQIGVSSQLLGNIKNVPNHQPGNIDVLVRLLIKVCKTSIDELEANPSRPGMNEKTRYFPRVMALCW